MTKKSRDAYDEDRRPSKKSSSSSHKSSSSRHVDDVERSKKKKSSGSKKTSKKAQAKKQRRRIILFILEIFVLLIMVIVLYVVMTTTRSGHYDIQEDEIIINKEVKETQTAKGDDEDKYMKIALFGVDSTTGALTKNTRSDTIMIASIDKNTGECKLVSVYRDTYLNLSNDEYNKCNGAYAKGGPAMAISMLNMNLDLDITDFVTVGFAGLTDTIDALGGVYIEVDSSEISHLNNYQLCIAEDLKRSYTPVTDTGYQLLNGLQATGYCRIRYTAGDDFKRAERQREVLSAVADQAKKNPSPAALGQIASNVFDEVYTSLDLDEIVALLGDVTKYNIVETSGFPQEGYRETATIGAKGSCVIPIDLEENVKWLHQFLFDEYDYTPSSMVQECSRKIEADTSSYIRK
ncbi:MAG: LCP family protein [Bacillus sp. (in: Bacteria)]|nr:LCP family protein [Bacillus sp. (in: firmicutes)]MCM1425622.1 LCP family protein [Eubacterium sp.]